MDDELFDENGIYSNDTGSNDNDKEFMCKADGCRKEATYGFNDAPSCCPLHRKKGMNKIMRSHNICSEKGCYKSANYGYYNNRRRIRCSLHKLAGMVDKKTKQCEYPYCYNYAYYGIDKYKFCAKHKTDGMENLKTKKTRKCLKCNKIPSCGFLHDRKRLYCAEHKISGTINFTNRSNK